MQVEIKAKLLYHDLLGRLKAGDVVDLPDAQANEFAKRGFVEIYETKVIKSEPENKKKK